ncbi:hypothetical protein V2J09_013185 [Rumex salicifolius]
MVDNVGVLCIHRVPGVSNAITFHGERVTVHNCTAHTSEHSRQARFQVPFPTKKTSTPNGMSLNEVYQASHLYLQDKISPWNEKLKVAKAYGDKKLSVTVNKGEEIADLYQGISLKWVMICTESEKKKQSIGTVEKKSFELSFSKEHREVIMGSYLPYVMEVANGRKEANRNVKLQSLGAGGAHWKSINLNHPSTFDTLAMDLTAKKAIMDDLDRFVDRREGVEERFNIYDVELTSIRDNTSLRSLLVSTQSRSMIVIEDIDCSIQLQNRKTGEKPQGQSEQFTLSGLLNFIDGLWSSCGEQRIIVFTTNYKDKLDPGLLRLGRMDMHIHMSYLTPSGFRVLAFNYLGVSSHPLLGRIEHLIEELEITPATVAEELMKDDDDPNSTLELLLEFLQRNKEVKKKSEAVCKSEVNTKSNQRKKPGSVEHEPTKVKGTKTRVKEI